MRKLIQILFLASLSFNVFAQEVKDSIPKQKESKWSVGISGGVNSSYRKLIIDKSKNPNLSSYKNLNKLNNQEKPAFDIGAEIHSDIMIGKYFHLRIGINFTRMTYRSAQLDSIYIGGDALFGSVFTSGNYELKHDIYSIPIAILYNLPFNLKKNSIYVGTGLFTGLVNQKYFINEKRSDTYPYPIKTYQGGMQLYQSLYVFFGVSYKFKNMAIFIEPNFQYSIMKLNAQRYDVNKKMYAYGINIGFNFFINNN